jgi:beta-lactamase regulating signal transducer with metallopeptidase domain
MNEWAIHLANASIQGGLALGTALVICACKVSANIKIWSLRLALVKLLFSGIFVGGLAVFTMPDGAPAASTVGYLVPNLMLVACGLWCVSVLTGLGRLVVSWRMIRRLVGSAFPLSQSPMMEEYRILCRRAGTRNAPRVRVQPAIPSPLLVQSGGPVILLPDCELSPGELSSALAHELAHHCLKDLKWSWLTAACDLLFFFHPLVPLALRKLRFYEECAADAAAMKMADSGPAQYSRALIGFAERGQVIAGGFAMSDSARDLSSRIRVLYQVNAPRTSAHWAAAALCLSIGALSLCPWRPAMVDAEKGPPGAAVAMMIAR